jgi:hypothetical protein
MTTSPPPVIFGYKLRNPKSLTRPPLRLTHSGPPDSRSLQMLRVPVRRPGGRQYPLTLGVPTERTQ